MIMSDAFGAAKLRLAREIESNPALPCKPIQADPWVISSLLQKAIRRCETEIAQRAAFTFFALKGSAIWRRLVVIAFEDIGIGSLDALTMTVATANDSGWRKNNGGDLRLALGLTGMLSQVSKIAPPIISVAPKIILPWRVSGKQRQKQRVRQGFRVFATSHSHCRSNRSRHYPPPALAGAATSSAPMDSAPCWQLFVNLVCRKAW